MCISQNVSKRRPLPFVPLVVPLKNNVLSSTNVENAIKPQLESFWAGAKRSTNSIIAGKDDRHIVKHDYHDHSDDSDRVKSDGDNAPRKPVARGGVTTPFPVKLHEMLDKIEEDGHAGVVSWQPHGRCFVVHKPKEFVEEIMPKYFKQSKFASFQRQLNLYGFVRLTRGRDKGGYYHELFLRRKLFLAQRIQRMKVKGTGVRARSNPDTEPCFYSMPPVSLEGDQHDEVGEQKHDCKDETVTKEQDSVQLPLQDQQLSAPAVEQPPLDQQQQPPEPMEQPSSFSVSTMDMTMMESEEDEDDVVLFEGKPFHYLDPFDPPKSEQGDLAAQPLQVSSDASFPVVSDEEDVEDPFTRNEMEDFLNDLHLPKDLYRDIMETVEDDKGFGYLLEKIIQ